MHYWNSVKMGWEEYLQNIHCEQTSVYCIIFEEVLCCSELYDSEWRLFLKKRKSKNCIYY